MSFQVIDAFVVVLEVDVTSHHLALFALREPSLCRKAMLLVEQPPFGIILQATQTEVNLVLAVLSMFF